MRRRAVDAERASAPELLVGVEWPVATWLSDSICSSDDSAWQRGGIGRGATSVVEGGAGAADDGGLAYGLGDDGRPAPCVDDSGSSPPLSTLVRARFGSCALSDKGRRGEGAMERACVCASRWRNDWASAGRD